MDRKKTSLLRTIFLETLEYPLGIYYNSDIWIHKTKISMCIRNKRLYRRHKDNDPRLVLNKTEADNAI